MEIKPLIFQASRFFLKELEQDDVTNTYLEWFKNKEVQTYILSSSNFHTIEQLKEYVHLKYKDPNTLFLGIFDASTSEHIGNIKFDPLVRVDKYAVVGILIGDERYRGIGVFSEVFPHCLKILSKHYGIRKIYLGVDITNNIAINAYKKNGFQVTENSPYISDNNTIFMKLCIPDLYLS